MMKLADEYFSTISPVASKIKTDINDIQCAYEHLWLNFNLTEQCDLINESIIKPEIVLKYLNSTKKYKNAIASPPVDHSTINIVYRDKHGAPYSSKTRSQIKLNLIGCGKDETIDDAATTTNDIIKNKEQQTLCNILLLNSDNMINRESCGGVGGYPVSASYSPRKPMIKKKDKDMEKRGGSGGGGGVGAGVAVAGIQTPTGKSLNNNNSQTKAGNLLSKILNSATDSNKSPNKIIPTSLLDNKMKFDDDMLENYEDNEHLVVNTNKGKKSQIISAAANRKNGNGGVSGGGGGVGDGGNNNDHDDDDDGGDSSLNSEEEEKQNFEEFNLLLSKNNDLKKGYDFLNNW